MSPAEVEQLLRKTIRVAKDGAILTYRNLLVKRSRPGSLAGFIKPLEQLAAELYAEDRSFIYRSYVVEQITKK
jgi:hypothetical protein